MRRYVLALSLSLLGPAALAQTPGNCAVGEARGTLDVSDVAATLYTTGMIAYGSGGTHEYYVPQGAGLYPLFASSVWVGGRVGGDFRVAGTTYGQGGSSNDYFEFWPGPLTDEGALPDPDDCSAYDRVWVVSVLDVSTYEQTGMATDDLRDWPVGLGAPAVDAAGAPVDPTSRGQTIDLNAGERPVISGSQTAFWVMNDVGGEHRTTGSAPLGIEVAVTAFSVASETPALNQATFYRYAITNRNTQPIEEARLSVWADPDIGDAGDDFVGVDTTRSLAYAYNADEVDRGGYGEPPAWGVVVLGGLADTESQPDLTSFVYMVGGEVDRGDPQTALEFERTMRGLWANGTPVTDFGTGYNQGGDPTAFAFPGDPVTGAFWSEENTGAGRAEPGEHRFALSTGPGTLAPGETRTVDIGLVFALGTDRLDSVVRLRAASDLVQAAYDDGSLFSTRPVPTGPPPATPALLAPEDGTGPLEGGVELVWASVPDAGEYLVEVSSRESFEHTRNSSVSVDTVFVVPPRSESGAVYWRVRAKRGSFIGPYSEVRQYTYRAALGPVLGVVEVVGPGGADPCAETAESRQGCPGPGARPSAWAPGNLVYGSFNGTGDYALSSKGGAGSELSVADFAPNDYEIRFVAPEEGSYGYYVFTSGTLIRLPIQVWDIGVVAPGEENDPSDDVRMVPVLAADGGPECVFGFNQPTVFSLGLTTQRIYAYYPTDDYAAFEALAAPLVEADSAGCPTVSRGGAVANAIDFDRGRPLQRDVIEDATGARGSDPGADFASLEGTVIRYYTNDDFATPAEDASPPSGAAVLGVPFPNPARQWAAVPFTVGTPGAVRLAVLDVLGREAAVLVDGPRPAGAHEARLDVSALAAGVYVVVLQTSDGRAARTVTVAR